MNFIKIYIIFKLYRRWIVFVFDRIIGSIWVLTKQQDFIDTFLSEFYNFDDLLLCGVFL